MKIGLVTNWNQNCAVAEYAKNLTYYCVRASKDVEFKVITGLLNYEGVESQIGDVDIIHFNYCRHAFIPMNPVLFNTFRGKGKPVIVTYHESAAWTVRRMTSCGLADWIVVHDRLRDGPPAPPNLLVIPFGIPEIDTSGVEVDKEVGTFGCAFPWKGLIPLAWACGQLGVKLTAQLSEADPDKGDIHWESLRNTMHEYCPKLELIEGWRSQDEIIRELARCKVLALPFDPQSPINGISSSVRSALAAKRPLVLTRFAHFSDLYDYAGSDIYFTESDELKTMLGYALYDVEKGLAKRPWRILNDMTWKRSAQLYCELYEESMKTQVIYSK